MTDDQVHGISRRSVLQRGAIAGGMLAVGVTGFSGTALASDCPRTPGFWANHDWCDVLVDPNDPDSASIAEAVGIDDGTDPCPDPGAELCLTFEDTGEDVTQAVCKTMKEWQMFLVANTRGDKAMKMAQTLLATNLNFSLRPSDDGTCVDRSVDFSSFGLEETTTVRDVRQRAEAWLEASGWDDTSVRRWTVNVDGTDVDGEPLKNVLDAFNNGEIETLDCDCAGTDE